MGTPVLLVNGLPVPEVLTQLIIEGRWKPPSDLVLAEIFGDEPDGPQFYGIDVMVRQNEILQEMTPEELSDLLGVDSSGFDLGLCVLIGDLGADMPIALDYRLSKSNPRIIYMAAEGWREVAPDIGALALRLSL